MKGRGSPFVGRRPKTTNKLRIIWSPRIVVAPKARCLPNESLAFQAIQYPLQMKIVNIIITLQVHDLLFYSNIGSAFPEGGDVKSEFGSAFTGGWGYGHTGTVPVRYP